MISLLFCIVLIKVVISDSSSEDDIQTLLDGEFRNADGFGFSSCTAENGVIYGTAGPITDDEITSYISLYARSTGGVIETPPGSGVYTSSWDVARFDSSKPTGVKQTTATMTRDTTTDPDTFTIQFDGEAEFVVTQIDEEGKRCLIPEANWNSINNQVPFIVESDELGPLLCPSEAPECIHIHRYDNAIESGGACWGYYDTENEDFFGGGDLSLDVLILFDGELRSNKGTDENGMPPCDQGIVFEVWTGEEEVTISFQCSDPSIGAMWTSDILEESDEEFTCPLFTSPGSSSAKKMSRENVLSKNVNDYTVENIVIKFSNTTIGNVWAILIVFILVTVIMCWFVHRKRSRSGIEQNFDGPHSKTYLY